MLKSQVSRVWEGKILAVLANRWALCKVSINCSKNAHKAK